MKKNTTKNFLGEMLRSIAPSIGAQVIIEPEWETVGQIIYKNGRKRYFRYSSLDINTLGASEIAKDKDYANFFMKKMGYPIVTGEKFYSREWCCAIGSSRGIHSGYAYARKIGFPVFVKPNSGSQGKGVCKVYTKAEFYHAMKDVFSRDRVALVQQPLTGNDYRIVVLDNQVISAYQRIPLNIVGDGKSTVHQLLVYKQVEFAHAGRDTKIAFNDSRIITNLRHQKLSMRSIIPKGTTVFLLDNANLSSGGDSIDVTKSIHADFKKIAIKLAYDMGLRLCGVDLMVQGSISNTPKTYWVLEINAAPGLDHYVTTGKKQEKIVYDLYRKVLLAMSKK